MQAFWILMISINNVYSNTHVFTCNVHLLFMNNVTKYINVHVWISVNFSVRYDIDYADFICIVTCMGLVSRSRITSFVLCVRGLVFYTGTYMC